MDALILSCGTGGGHNSACEAIRQELAARGHRAVTLNPYLLKGKKTAETIDNTYIGLVQKLPAAFGVVYRLGNAYRRLPVPSPVYYINRGMVPLLESFLREHHFDAIVTTHLFPAEILTNMRRCGISMPVTYYVATDYTCIPFTEETDCDYYVIPSEALKEEFVSSGIPEERILPLGIPVERQFREKIRQDEARKHLGLDTEMKYILIAGGSIGAGQIEQIVPLLLDHYQDSVRLIIVCGNNHTLYQHLERNYQNRCILLGYTPQMAEYMCACDLFVSKPGGLSSTEAAVAGVPLVHITPIPGCETRNMAFFEKHGLCLAAGSPKDHLTDACDRLLDKACQQEMKENQHKFIPGDAALSICRFMEEVDQGLKNPDSWRGQIVPGFRRLNRFA